MAEFKDQLAAVKAVCKAPDSKRMKALTWLGLALVSSAALAAPESVFFNNSDSEGAGKASLVLLFEHAQEMGGCDRSKVFFCKREERTGIQPVLSACQTPAGGIVIKGAALADGRFQYEVVRPFDLAKLDARCFRRLDL